MVTSRRKLSMFLGDKILRRNDLIVKNNYDKEITIKLISIGACDSDKYIHLC